MKNEKIAVAPKTVHSQRLKSFRTSAALILTTLMLMVATGATAQTFTTLHIFDLTDGADPYAGLIQATDGNLYGTTYSGGANEYDGTVFKITPSGTLTTLHSFDGTDGYDSRAGLVQATNGDFYGTTSSGGAEGVGTVFKITPGGALTTLHSFDGADGTYPYAGLVQATNGNLYGTTVNGGPGGCAGSGCGTVFKITPSGTLTTLHYFGGTDGSGTDPWAGLVQATNGDLYGTTLGGNGVYGTVFKITPSGMLTTLHGFDITDGEYPVAGLVQVTNGDLYGVTEAGGTNGDGTVFKITPSGELTTLYSFCSGGDCTDGREPEGGLVQATDGNLYGTTYYGGANGYGTVFKITPSGTLTTLHSFDGTDGTYPYAGLIQDTNGTFYGTTQGGGSSEPPGYGTVFSLSVGLGPFVETQTTSGKEGTKIGILGQGFSSSSVVKFGGTQATTITLTGTTFISATVPGEALTGSVTVTTGTTTLTSTKTFDVLPTITGFTPESGPVGTPVTITGTGLKQTTKVTFDGKAATFTVISDTEVTADVPADAVTGKITVTTKGGSATSATSFTVD
jgi:uncharacterized repeat protein (TIGR03803 family)